MKLLITLAFLALVSVSLAQLWGQPVLTGVGEIALDGHSKIAYHGYGTPVGVPNAYNRYNALPYGRLFRR